MNCRLCSAAIPRSSTRLIPSDHEASSDCELGFGAEAVARVGGIEGHGQPVGATCELQVEREGDRTAVEPDHEGAGDVLVSETKQRRAMEALPGFRDEPRRVAAASPAQLVDDERFLDRLRHLLATACDLALHGAETLELPQAPASLAARLRGQPRGVLGLPALTEVTDGRIESLDEAERALREGGDEPAGARQAEKIDEVVVALAGSAGELVDDGRCVLARSDERVGEDRPRPADELAHADAEPPLRAERKRSDQAVSPVRDVDGELGVLTVVAPPLHQPGVEQERARARHGPDELVPGPGEALEAGLGRDRLEPEARLPRRGRLDRDPSSGFRPPHRPGRRTTDVNVLAQIARSTRRLRWRRYQRS